MEKLIEYLKTTLEIEDASNVIEMKKYLQMDVCTLYPELEIRYYALLKAIYNMPLILSYPRFDDSILFNIPSHIYDDMFVIPLYIRDNVFHVCVSDPSFIHKALQLKAFTVHDIHVSLTYHSQLKAYLTTYKNHLKYQAFKQLLLINPIAKPLKKQSLSLEEGPMIAYAKAIIEMSMQYESSDIHIIYDGSKGLIKCRIEGELHTIQTHDVHMHEALIRRYLVLSSLDTIQKEQPQDGMFHMTIESMTYAFRLAVMKSYYNLHAVIRIIHTYKKYAFIDTLGMTLEHVSHLRSYLKKHTGFLIVTGNTGSGKSTTIHAILETLHQEKKHTITIENPVEHIHSGMTQIDMKASYGMSFEDVLKHCLRMDPDHLFIGEIRDQKTAEIAVHAALTGHFVCATMHTFKPDHIHQRLLHLGMDRHSLTDIPLLNIHQVLIPKLCIHCMGKGCYACLQRGFIKRIAVFELNQYDMQSKKMVRIGPSLTETFHHLYVRQMISEETLHGYLQT